MGPKKSNSQNESKKNEMHPDDIVSTPGLTEEEQISQLEKDVEAESSIHYVDSSARPANQNQNSRKKGKRVWTEISYLKQPKSNSNYVASCTAGADGLKSVDYARRGRDFRNHPQNSQPNRWCKRRSWNKASKESAKPEIEVSEEETQIREKSLNVNQLRNVIALDQLMQSNQPHQDLSSNEIPQSKIQEVGEAQLSHVPDQLVVDKPTDTLQQVILNEHFNTAIWSNLNLALGPSIAPVEYLPMITNQHNEIQIPNQKPPSFIHSGAISPEPNPSPGPQSVELDELAERIKENPDKVRAHRSFKENEVVRNAIAPYVFPTPTDDEKDNTPCDRIVYIGDELYLRIVNKNYTRFLRFSDRAAFISHHVKHYFSEENLLQDKHLKNLLRANKGVCPFEDLCEFFRLKMVNTDVGDLVECANLIENVELVADSSFIPIGYRLTIPLPEPKLDDRIGTSFPEIAESSPAHVGGYTIQINGVSNVTQFPAENVADAINVDISYNYMSNQLPLSIVDPNNGAQILPENKTTLEDQVEPEGNT